MVFNQELCEQRHKEIDKQNKEILDFLLELKQGQQSIQKKLFVDNGTESIQSRINRMDNWIKGVCVAVFAIGIPVALLLINLFLEKTK